jgi:hypothetical protein
VTWLFIERNGAAPEDTVDRYDREALDDCLGDQKDAAAVPDKSTKASGGSPCSPATPSLEDAGCASTVYTRIAGWALEA